MYNIKILSDQEFDSLPYKHASNHEVCGLADPKINTAYVRNNMPETARLLTMDHELQELTSQFSEHEKDGIRYGWFKKIFGFSSQPIVNVAAPTLAAMIPGVGPVMSALLAAGTSAVTQQMNTGQINPAQVEISALRGGLIKGAMLPGIGEARTAGQGMFGQMWAGGRTALGMQSGVQPSAMRAGAQSLLSTTSPTTPVSYNLGGVSGVTGVTTMPGWTLESGYGAQTGLTTAGSTMLSGSTNLQTPQTTQQSSNLWRTTQTKSAGSNIGMDFLKSPATKMGLSLMGVSGMVTSPPPPEIGPMVSKWLTADTVTKAGAKARAIADVEYAGEWTPDKETMSFMDVMGKDISKAYKEKVEQMDKANASVNENWNRSGERLEMIKQYGEAETREIDAMKAEWLLTSKKQFDVNRYNYVMDSLNVDNTTKQDLLYGEMYDVLYKYQIAETDLQNFRQLAADAGMYMVSGGMGLLGTGVA